jgi:hypothetical protein
MPQNQVNDLITDQEMAFARMVLEGAMTDRQAAEAAGLNPETAAYTKAKPRVRQYMIEHRAAVQKQIVEQEAQQAARRNSIRERILVRLWELADLSHEVTRNSITGQIKAISMIIAIEDVISEPRVTKSPSPDSQPRVAIYQPPWLLERKAREAADKAGFDLVRREGRPSEANAGNPWGKGPESPHDPVVHPPAEHGQKPPGAES